MLEIFRTQQQTAHDQGLRTTIQMTYASLFNAEAVALAKEHHARFGDEIGSTFLGLQCEEFRARFKSKELAIWLFSIEDKRRIVDEVLGFREVFGFYLTSPPAPTTWMPSWSTTSRPGTRRSRRL